LCFSVEQALLGKLAEITIARQWGGRARQHAFSRICRKSYGRHKAEEKFAVSILASDQMSKKRICAHIMEGNIAVRGPVQSWIGQARFRYSHMTAKYNGVFA
jgi:hypothetical protein